MQAAGKSDFLKIERDCKQGDPISPYLFILCGQILSYVIKDNDSIKGLYIYIYILMDKNSKSLNL